MVPRNRYFTVQSTVINCVALPTKKTDILTNVPTTKTLEARLPPFFPEDISSALLAPNASIEPNLSDQIYMSSLVQFRKCDKATALFVPSFGSDLVVEG